MNSGEVCGGGEGVRAEPADLSGGWVGSSSSGWRKQVDSRRPGHKSFFFTKSLAGMTAGCHMATSLSLSLAVIDSLPEIYAIEMRVSEEIES